MIGPVEAIFVIPAIAIPILALISNYRLGAGLYAISETKQPIKFTLDGREVHIRELSAGGGLGGR